MKKRRIRTKHKKIIKRVICVMVMAIVLITFVIVVKNYQAKEEAGEALLLIEEKTTYEKRRIEVESMNNIYDYSRHGYQKLIDGDKVSTLIISETSIGDNNKYKIHADWQLDYEQTFNSINNQENNFSNILLRGSNMMWAYMQVSSDLSGKDFDFVIVELSSQDINQLEEEDYLLYYEGLLRQLYQQFEDVKVIVVMDEVAIKESISEESNKQILNKVNELNSKYFVESLPVNNVEDIAENLNAVIEKELDLQIDVNDSVINTLDLDQLKVTNDLHKLEGLAYNLLPSEAEGFMIKQGLFFNNAATNHMTYEAENEYIFLNYVKFVDGCEIEVFINEQLYITLDSYSQTTGVGVLALPLNKGKRTITIVAKSELGSDKYLMMDNLLVGHQIIH